MESTTIAVMRSTTIQSMDNFTLVGNYVSLDPVRTDTNSSKVQPKRVTHTPIVLQGNNSSKNTTAGNVTAISFQRTPTVPEITDAASKIWENVKKILGFSPDCKNSGHKNLRGNCVCTKYFEGPLCEKIICINNGTRKSTETCV
jgi:hypothetical protein